MSSSASLLSLHQLRPRHASSHHHSPLPHPLFFTVPGRPPHRIPLPPPALSRRLFLPSASFIWDAITGGTSALEASSAVRRGMLLFRQIFGREGFPCITWTGVSSSPFLPNCRSRRRVLWKLKRIEDVAFMLKPNAGSRKGPSSSGQMLLRIPMIPRSLYGAFYVKLNFTELKKPGEDSCRRLRNMFSRHQVGRDPRPFMREAYNMFKDGGDPEKFFPLFLSIKGCLGF